MNKWSGKRVSDVSVSLGYAEKCERQWENFEELAEQADERMYACKAEYYSKKEKTGENCRLHIMHLQSYILKYLSLILHRIHIRL